MKKTKALIAILASACSLAVSGCLTTFDILEVAKTGIVEEEDIFTIILENIGIGEKSEYWQTKHFVDSFGDKTDQKYISGNNKLLGTFSNSATDNSKLTIHFIIEKDDVALKLFEYGSFPVKGEVSEIKYDVKMKTDDGQQHDLGYAYNNSDRIQFSKKDSLQIIKYLAANRGFKLLLYEANTGDFAVNSRRYLITIPEITGFSVTYLNTYPELFPDFEQKRQENNYSQEVQSIDKNANDPSQMSTFMNDGGGWWVPTTHQGIKDDPVPIRDGYIDLDYKYFGQEVKIRIGFSGIYRGTFANNYVKNSSIFNSSLQSPKNEYAIIYCYVKNLNDITGNGKPIELRNNSFTVVDNRMNLSDPLSLTLIEGLNAKLFENGNAEGWVAVKVPKGEPAYLVLADTWFLLGTESFTEEQWDSL